MSAHSLTGNKAKEEAKKAPEVPDKNIGESDSSEKVEVKPICDVIKWLCNRSGVKADLAKESGKAYMENVQYLEDLCQDPTLHAFSLKKVIDRQSKKAAKIKEYIPVDESDGVLNTIGSVLQEMVHLQCGICGLPGHSPSYCWLNG